jgi:putative pre-16S rRNA nuclease
MPEGVFLGFDFGMKRIGVAVGQQILGHAKPLKTLPANRGLPNWQSVAQLINLWKPQALIVGLPCRIDGKAQFTTHLAKKFSKQMHEMFELPIHLVDERLTSVEARQQLFEEGGYRKLQKSEVDSYAAKLIVEQFLKENII